MIQPVNLRAHYRVTECLGGDQVTLGIHRLGDILARERYDDVRNAVYDGAQTQRLRFTVPVVEGLHLAFERVTDNAALLSPDVNAVFIANYDTGDYSCLPHCESFIGPVVYYVDRNYGDGCNLYEIYQRAHLFPDEKPVAGPLGSLPEARTVLWQDLTGSLESAPDEFARWITNDRDYWAPALGLNTARPVARKG